MENIVRTEQLYEGKAKKVFATNNDNYVIVDYKDDATAFNGEKKGTINNKGVINNRVNNRTSRSNSKKYSRRLTVQKNRFRRGYKTKQNSFRILL